MKFLKPPRSLIDLKAEAQAISYMIEPIMEEEDGEEFKGMLNSVSVLNQVTPEYMAGREEEKIPS